jgi:hypothetical protein
MQKLLNEGGNDRLVTVAPVIMNSTIIWNAIYFNLFKISRLSEKHVSTYRFRLISCLAYISTLKMEATCCSEFQQVTRCYDPEDRPAAVQCGSLGSSTV